MMRRLVPIAILVMACGGSHESPTTPLPQRTVARMSVDSSCSAYSQYPVHVTITSVSTGFKTAEFAVWYNQAPVDVELPNGGAYKVFGWYGPSLLQIKATWEFTSNVTEGMTNSIPLRCVSR